MTTPISIELITERGGNYFAKEEDNVLVSPVGDDTYLIVEHITQNYPAWGIYTKTMTKDEAVDFCHKYYYDWLVIKANLPITTVEDYIHNPDDMYQDIRDEAIDHAEKHDYTLNDDTILEAIHEAAKVLKYKLTPRMIVACQEEIKYSVE